VSIDPEMMMMMIAAEMMMQWCPPCNVTEDTCSLCCCVVAAYFLSLFSHRNFLREKCVVRWVFVSYWFVSKRGAGGD